MAEIDGAPMTSHSRIIDTMLPFRAGALRCGSFRASTGDDPPGRYPCDRLYQATYKALASVFASVPLQRIPRVFQQLGCGLCEML